MSGIKTTFLVTAMKCEGCVNNVRNALATVDGFESVDIDLAQGVAVVSGDVDPQAVCTVLQQAGYPAVVKSK
jgi:copper chaperone CopZ